jgi:hypothetical protein
MVRRLQSFDRTETGVSSTPCTGLDAGTARVAGTCSAYPFVRWDFFSFAARGCRLVQVFDIGHVISPVLLERAGDAGL